jgi:hypothetical protein
MRSEELRHQKIPMTPSGIKPATFRFVAQCLNQLLFCSKSKDIMVERGRGVQREYHFIPLLEGHVSNRTDEG